VYGDTVRGAGGVLCLPKGGVLYAGRHRGVLGLSKDVLHKIKYCSEYLRLQAQIRKNFKKFQYQGWRRTFAMPRAVMTGAVLKHCLSVAVMGILNHSAFFRP
jgi:hypothetical protein